MNTVESAARSGRAVKGPSIDSARSTRKPSSFSERSSHVRTNSVSESVETEKLTGEAGGDRRMLAVTSSKVSPMRNSS